MIIISSKEFRDNQRKYFDKVDNGEQVIIRRGKDKAYQLSAVTLDDRYFTPEMVEKLNRSIEQAKNGQVKKLSNIDDIKKLLYGGECISL